jgi:hypothetical protein
LAHEAYLAGDWVEMGERLKDVLVDPHAGELAQGNAFELLERAYEATHGNLPARTALPPTVKRITLGVVNGANPFGAHRMVFLDMRVAQGRTAHVKDVRLTRLPSEPILALADNRGVLQIKHVEAGFEDIDVEVRGLETLPDRGAFGIHIAFDDAPAFDTFVLANKMVGSTQPEVTSPDVNQVLADARPEIGWLPYRSPQYASWEDRSVWMGISGSAKSMVWDFYKWAPGELASVPVTKSLEPDSYWLSVMCTEERTFGGIRLSRATESGRPFSVVR